MRIAATYVGGPTALLEVDGVSIITDPTFDSAPQEYRPGPYRLRKLVGPRIDPESIDRVDAALLSHDHHVDNLDTTGRDFLKKASIVLTTSAAAKRLGRAVGLEPWQTWSITGSNGRQLHVTAVPAQHGPISAERGPVIGFIVSDGSADSTALYVSGDTVFFDRMRDVAKRFQIAVALLFMGAARIPEVGSSHLTLTAEEAVGVACLLPDATIVPLHYDGWDHYTERQPDIQRVFVEARLAHRLQWLQPGRRVLVTSSIHGDQVHLG